MLVRILFSRILNCLYAKGGFKSEDTEEFFRCQNKYSKSLSWAENLNKLFTVLGGKFKFSAQDSDLEYSFWRSKNLPDLKPPLGSNQMLFTSGKNTEFLKGCAIFHKIPTLRLHFTFLRFLGLGYYLREWKGFPVLLSPWEQFCGIEVTFLWDCMMWNTILQKSNL